MSLLQDVQYRIKTTSSSLFVVFLRVITGLFLGLSLSIIGHEILQYGQIAYWFVFVLSLAVFIRISKGWGAWGVVIFNLVCLLIGMLLRMYILIAPGA